MCQPPTVTSFAPFRLDNNNALMFHKFVPREGKQGQINSGKLSTYQPGVERIARDGHEEKHENDTKSCRAVVARNSFRNSFHPRLVSRKFSGKNTFILILYVNIHRSMLR